ncbi:NAPDH-dependent diflavin reductase [Malassezia obtusa]|uniref:NAPDH-dependent diflavin reductase n=1 Tax=Malassezia obtusa TaxID=76774 RepID=A0AAF0E5A4_9BASI|nr:NAPDH-dependent diflavin reductase [Malassezia obtusa]
MEPAPPAEVPAEAAEDAGHPDVPPNDEFSEGSELTEEGESDADRTVQPPQHAASDDDNSPLSEASEHEGQAQEAPNALEDLASVASTTANLEESMQGKVPTTSSPLSSEEEEQSTTVEPPATPRKGRSTLRRAVIAAAGKRRAAATGGAPSLLVEPDAESSAPPSAATSRQNSPESEAGERAPALEGDALETDKSPAKAETVEPEVPEGDAADDEASEKGAEPEAADDAAEQDSEEKDTGTPAAEGAEQDDVEAMQRRQEAIDLLTRVEIGYAMLRDRLYNERLEELEAESEMIHDGTHPELQLLHMIIDARRDRRLALLSNWLQEEEKERERWAKVEDETAWVNWRDDAAGVRRALMDDTMRKRRRLDREKRMLDTPQPPRRHQPFEAELVRKPPAYSRRSQRDLDRYDYAMQPIPREDIHSYLAYPDLRGLDEYDVCVDMDQMGIRPMPPMYPNYVRQEEMAMHDMYPAYGPPPSGAPYAPPYALPPGYIDRAYDVPVPVDEYAKERPMPEYDAPYKGYAEPYADPAPYPPGMPYMPPRAPVPA